MHVAVMNYLDIVIVVISFIGVTSGEWPNLSAVRLLRWFHNPKERKFGKSDETPSPLVLFNSLVVNLIGLICWCRKENHLVWS